MENIAQTLRASRDDFVRLRFMTSRGCQLEHITAHNTIRSHFVLLNLGRTVNTRTRKSNPNNLRMNPVNKGLRALLLRQTLDLDASEDAAALSLDQALRVGHQAAVQVLEEVEQVAGQNKHVRLYWHLDRKFRLCKTVEY